jgi:predicted transcriptional regulator
MTTTIRVSDQTHDALRLLAETTGEPMARLVERAVERLTAEQFFSEIDRAYEQLARDPKALSEETAEREAWDVTLADGLDDDDDE